MDFVGLASSFVTLIGFSMQLYANCKDYVGAVKGKCPGALKLILVEASSLKSTLQAIDDLLKLSETPKEDMERLSLRIGQALKECHNCLDELLKLVPKPIKDGELSKRDKAMIYLKALRWSDNKEKIEAELEKLKTHKATLSLGLTAELSYDVKKIGADVAEVKSSVNTMQVKLDEAQRARVLKWLEKVDPSKNHNSASEARHDNTGEWLTGGQDWKSWINGDPDPKSQFLWIYGIPGAGKTFLACSMIKKVSCHVRNNSKQGLAYAYYYCYHGRASDEKDEAVNLLRSVISQLCGASKSIPVILNDLFDSRREPTVSDLLDCLEAALTQFTTAYIVVDAVDESDPRPKLIDVLSRLASDKRFAKLRLAATSRDYLEIRKAFEPRSVAISMANSKVTEDIRKYVTNRLKDEKCERWPQGLRDEIALRVPNNAQGMFRYAACQLDVLIDCNTVKEVQQKCSSLPKTLDETYERILGAIAGNHKGDVIRALGIVIGSLRDGGRICIHTLVNGVKAHQERDSFFDINTLRKQCVSLIKIDADETVALAHYTVREFLESNRINKTLSDFHLPGEKADEIFCNTVMLAASRYRHRNDSDLHNVREYRNGDPVDFTLYGLRQTRLAMIWDRRALLKPKNKKGQKGKEEVLVMEIKDGKEKRKELVLKAKNKDLARDLLNPYGPAFRGLQLLGCDDHSDTFNEQQLEWLVKFNDKADAMEKAAAHLTMLLSFDDHKGLAQAFLEKVENKAALFKTEMKVTFPVDWKIFSQRGKAGGHYDSDPTSVTVLGFYEKGRERGFDTQAKIKMIRDNFGSYLPAKAPVQKTPAPTSSNTKSSPGHGTPTPADKASGESSKGRGTPGGGGAQPSHGKPNPASNTSDQKKPQAQSHGQPQTQTQTGQGQSKPQAQSHGGQGQGKAQAQSQNQGHGKPQAQSQSQGQGNQGHGNQGQGKPQTQSQTQGQGNQGQGSQGQGKPQAQSQSQGQGNQSQTQGQSKPQTQSQNQGQGQDKPQAHSQSQGQNKSAQSTGTPTTNNGGPSRNPQTTQGAGSSSKDTAR